MNTNTLSPNTLLRGKSYTYTIQKVLGQGTFGITYLATTQIKVHGALGELETTMQVAVKEFFMRDINGREENTVTTGSKGGIYANYKKKFAREAENLSKLKHPHIVKVLEFFEANNTVYYAMEYVEGGSLDNYIKQQNGLPEAECLKYAQQIGSALSYMHAHKMLHLDLKPGNVMLRKNGEAVLIDFGLSKQYDENGEPESSTSVGSGTPGYAPIEQANYHEGKDFPVTMDVYALGATLFKMLTGVRPPEASVILNEGFPAYELQKHHVSNTLIAQIAKAMADRKKDRPQSVDAFLQGLGGKNTTIKKEDEKTDYKDEKTDYKKEPVKKKVIFATNISHFYFSFCESTHPNYHSFEADFTPEGFWVQSYTEGQLINRKQYPFSRTQFEALIESINSLKLYEVPEIDNKGITGGEKIYLNTGKAGKQRALYHYGNKQFDAGTLIGDVYPLLELIKGKIPDYANLWKNKTSVINTTTNKTTAKYDKYIITGLLIVIGVIGAFLFMGRNDGNRNYTPSYEEEYAAEPIEENIAVDSIAVADSVAVW